MALLDAGFSTLEASSDPTSKAAVVKALAKLNTTTMVGKVDFNTGPFPNVSVSPIIGCQWIKAKPGSKYKFDFVTVDHATDPKVPIQAKLKPFNA
jgi:branched-chain amino acid transport system substrate-binding protein